MTPFNRQPANDRWVIRTQINRAYEAIERHDNLTVSPPLEIVRTVTGNHIRLQREGFWAVLGATSGAGSLYVIHELATLEGGSFEIYTGGTSEVAWEVNGVEGIEAGTIVWVRPGHTGEWVFEYGVGGSSGSLILNRLGSDVSVSGMTISIPYAAGISSSTFTGIAGVSSNSGGTLTASRQTIGGVKIFTDDAVFYDGTIWLRHDQTYPFVGSAVMGKTAIQNGGAAGAFIVKHWTADTGENDWVDIELRAGGSGDATQFHVRDNFTGEGTQLVLWDSSSTFKEGATGTNITGATFYGGICDSVGSSPYYIDFPEHGVVTISNPAANTFRLHNANGTFGYYDDAGVFTALGSKSTEQVQDDIGGILDDGTTGQIDFTYDDTTPKISGVVKAGSVTLAMIDSGAGFSGSF